MNTHLSKDVIQMATKHMKRCSTSLIHKTTVRCHFTPIRMVWKRKEGRKEKKKENVEKLESSCIAGGNIKWCSHWEYGNSSKRKKNEHKITVGSSNSTSEYITKRAESKDLTSYLYTNIYSSIIQNRQKVETTVHWQMNQ